MNDDLPLKASVKAGEVKAGEAISGLQKPAKQMSGLSSTDFLRAADPDILLAVPAGAKMCQKREKVTKLTNMEKS